MSLTLIALVTLACATASAAAALYRLVSPAPLGSAARGALIVGGLLAALVMLGTAISLSTHVFCTVLDCASAARSVPAPTPPGN